MYEYSPRYVAFTRPPIRNGKANFSYSGFYFGTNSNLNITWRISRQNLLWSGFLKNAIFVLEYEPVFEHFSSENLSPSRLNLNICSNFRKIQLKKTETSNGRCCSILITNSKYEFSGHVNKFPKVNLLRTQIFKFVKIWKKKLKFFIFFVQIVFITFGKSTSKIKCELSW